MEKGQLLSSARHPVISHFCLGYLCGNFPFFTQLCVSDLSMCWHFRVQSTLIFYNMFVYFLLIGCRQSSRYYFLVFFHSGTHLFTSEHPILTIFKWIIPSLWLLRSDTLYQPVLIAGSSDINIPSRCTRHIVSEMHTSVMNLYLPHIGKLLTFRWYVCLPGLDYSCQGLGSIWLLLFFTDISL